MPLSISICPLSPQLPSRLAAPSDPSQVGNNFRGVAYHYGDLDNAVAGIKMVVENESTIGSIANQNWRCADQSLAALGLPTYIIQVLLRVTTPERLIDEVAPRRNEVDVE